MNMQDILDKIRNLEIAKNNAETKINDIDRVDRITIHYRKTKDIIGNSGVPEADNGYSVDIGTSQYQHYEIIYPDIFESMKALWLEKLQNRYDRYKAELELMEEKKNDIENYINSIMKQDEA